MALIKDKAWALENPIFFTPPPVRGKYGRLFGGGGDAPPPPDPIKTAQAQSDANNAAAEKQANLNRTNSVTPFGTSTWTTDPNNPDSWTNTVKLDDKTQGLVDEFYKNANSPLPSTDTAGLPEVKPVDFGNLPGVSSADLSGIKLPNAQDLIAGARSQFTDNGAAIARSNGLAQSQAGITSELQNLASQTYSKGLDYSSLGAMPTADYGTQQKIQQALYANSTRTLDPAFQQQQSDLSSSLAAQGINLGSDAYDRAMQNFGRTKNDAYDQARNDALTTSTDQMQKLFGMQMAGRQEGVSEINNVYNSPMDLLGKSAGIYGGLEDTLNHDYATQTAQRTAAQNIASQQFGDQLAGAGQQATDIINQHNMTAADRVTAMQQAQAVHDSSAQDRTNAYNQMMGVHQSALNDRNNILNELTALSGGSQVAPGSAVQVAAAPVAQSIYNSYQGQLSNYNAQMQSKNSFTSMLGSLGGSAMMALAMA